MALKIAFTGTGHGMTPQQLAEVRQGLKVISSPGDVLHHGGCVGADLQMHDIAHNEFHLTIEMWPARGKHIPDWAWKTSEVVHPRYPPLERNHYIVADADALIATPYQAEEIRRSGTWATIRYARKVPGCVIYIITPEGKVK